MFSHRCWDRTAFAFKQGFALRLDFFFPLAHLHGMHTKLLADLIDGLNATHCFKSNLGLKFSRVQLEVMEQVLDFTGEPAGLANTRNSAQIVQVFVDID